MYIKYPKINIADEFSPGRWPDSNNAWPTAAN